MDESFSGRLRARLGELGWSAHELGRRSGVHHGTISHALSGNRTPSIATAAAIAAAVEDPGLLDAHPRSAAAVRAPVPAQLQREPWLAGREQVLDEAVRFCRGQSGPVVIFTGPGGIGKTSVASALAHRLAVDCPDGQLFADFRGWTPNQETPVLDVLASWCRSLGAAHPGGDADEILTCWRSITRGRRLIVFADNLRGGDTAAAIGLPHPGVITIVTSRDRRVGGVAAHDPSVLRLDLDGLDHDAAVAVLARRSGLHPQLLGELATAAGGLPLALAAAGTRLSHHSSLDTIPLRGMIQTMTTDLLQPGDGAWTATKHSYDELSPDAQRAWRWCARIGPRLPFGEDAAIMGWPQGRTLRALDETVRESLLGTAGLGWVWHDLYQQWAAEEAPEDDPGGRDAGIQRGLAWLATAFVEAGDRLVPGRKIAPEIPALDGVEVHLPHDHDSLLTWCDTLWAVWPAHVRTALRHGWHDWAWRLVGAVMNYAFLRKHWATWDAVTREVAAALPAHDQAGLGWCAHVRASIAGERGDHDTAVALAGAAVAHRTHLGDHAGLGWSALTEARFRAARGDATEHVDTALHIAITAHQHADIANGLALAWMFTAGTRLADGDHTGALAAVDSAEHAQPDPDADPTLRALISETRGRIHLADGDLDDAERALARARTIADTADDLWSLIGIHLALAELATARHDHDTARAATCRAAVLADHIGDTRARTIITT